MSQPGRMNHLDTGPGGSTFIHTDDVTDPYCTSSSAVKLFLFCTDGVLFSTEHPPPYCISSSALHIVYAGCAVLNALSGSQIKHAALDPEG